MPSHTISERRKRGPSSHKAKKILTDGSVRGHPLTEPQRGLFGAIAGGADIRTKAKKRRKRVRRA